MAAFATRRPELCHQLYCRTALFSAGACICSSSPSDWLPLISPRVTLSSVTFPFCHLCFLCQNFIWLVSTLLLPRTLLMLVLSVSGMFLHTTYYWVLSMLNYFLMMMMVECLWRKATWGKQRQISGYVSALKM